MLNRALLPLALILLLSPLAPLSCGGDDGSATQTDTRQLSPREKQAAEKGEPSFPDSPVKFATATLQGDETLSLSPKVQGLDGKKKKLSALIDGNSLVYYTEPDTDDRQNRAASRLLRKLVQSGKGAGFRTVIVFTRGTMPAEVDTWYEKRGVERRALAVIDADGEFADAADWKPRTAALVDEKGTIGAFFPPSERWDSRLGTEGGLTADLLALAWRMPTTWPDVETATKQAALDLVEATIAADAAGADTPSGAALKDGGLGTKMLNRTWVSLFRTGTTQRLRGEAPPGPLGNAIHTATRAALDSAGSARAEWLGAADTIRVAIDLGGKVDPLPTRYHKSLWYLIEPGVHGLVATSGDKEAVVLPAESVTIGHHSPRVKSRTAKLDATMGVLTKNLRIGKKDWEDPAKVKMGRFRTTSFGSVQPGGTVTDTFRGNVLWGPDLSEKQLLESIRTGGEWLAKTVGPDGKFDYEYYPNKDAGSTDYNYPRHVGSVYGLFEMYEFSLHEPALKADAPMYIEGASRAMGFVYGAFKKPAQDDQGDRVCPIDDRGRCESGTTALALMAFMARPDQAKVPKALHANLYSDDDDRIKEGLGLTLLDMIDPQGKVFRGYKEAKAEPRVKREPLYYPGEVMLALMKFYEDTKDPRWLEGARKIGDRQVLAYKEDRFITPDHWVMQAFFPLWLATKDDAYVKTSYAMATHYSSEQYGHIWSPWPDYDGSWRRTNDTPRTTRAGSRSEALRAVVNLAWERGDDAAVWEDSLLWSARHLAEQQLGARQTFWAANPEKVEGAYRMGLVDNHCRIDNNQHALVGMVGALNVMRRRAGGK